MPDLADDLDEVTGLDRAALIITDVSSPALVVVATLVAVSWHSADSLAEAAAVVLVSVFFIAALPYGYLQWRLRNRGAGDRHVQVRSQRLPLLVFGLVSTVVGAAVLVAMDAPREVLALVAADVAGLAVVSVLTRRWKVSMHTSVSGGAVVIAVLTFGPAAALLAPLLAPIAWARRRLRHHSLNEIVAGFVVGAAVAGAVFGPLR